MTWAITALSDAITSAALAQGGEQAAPVQAVGVPGASATPVAVPAAGEAAPLVNGPTTQPQGASGGMGMMIWLLPLVMIVMILMTSQAGKKDRKRREEMMKSLKRQDKVVTAGGIIGTIIEMNDDEVVLRVEEGKLRVSRASVSSVLREGKATTVAEVKGEAKVLNS